MAQKDLIPMNKRTKAEQKKIAQKGGIASGKARREKKTTQKIIADFLDIEAKDSPPFAKLASKLELESDKSVKSIFTMACLLNSVKSGNLDDLKTLIGLLGEKVETEQKTTPAIEELAKSLFGDE